MSDLRTAALEVERLQAARERDNVSFKQLLAQRDELLEALKGLVAWADDLRRDDPVEDLRKARAAIAKAQQ